MTEALSFEGGDHDNRKRGKEIGLGQNKTEERKREWTPKIIDGATDKENPREIEERIITKEMRERTKREFYSSNYYELREQETPPPLRQEKTADQIIEAYLPGASKRNDGGVLGETININIELTKKINRESAAVGEKLNVKYKNLINEIVGEGSIDIVNARIIRDALDDLYRQLQAEIKSLGLEEINKSTDEIVKQINKNIFIAGDELGSKYTHLLMKALRGGRAVNVERAKEMNEKVKSLDEQLQAEINPELNK